VVAKKLKYTEVKEAKTLKLDLGAGKGATTPDGFTPIDKVPFKGITVVDLSKLWPWKTASVDEVHSSCLVNYLTAAERVHFFNELHRVLKPGGQAQIITPMWSAYRAYVDLRVQWPPVSEGFYHTLSKGWREAQNSVDTSGLNCDFEVKLGYGMHPAIVVRNTDYQQDAVAWWKEAAQDLIANLTKV
jgi:predicted SAM-dependent methyltransferase